MKRTILTMIVGGMMVFGSRGAQAQQQSRQRPPAALRLRLGIPAPRASQRPLPGRETIATTRSSPISPAAIERRKAHDRDMLARLGGIPRTGLSKQDALSYDLFKREKRLAIEGQQFPTELLALDQLDGPQLMMSQLAEVMPFHH